MTYTSNTPLGSSNTQLTTTTTAAAAPICCNNRCVHASCPHITLIHCPAHPECPTAAINTCPNARETFRSVTFRGKCAYCLLPSRLSEHNAHIAVLQNMQRNVAASRALAIEQRTNLPSSGYDAATAFNTKVQLNRRNAEIDQASQRLSAELQDLERQIQVDERAAFIAQSELIGVFIDSSENREWETVQWLTCEEDDELWTWGMEIW